MWLITIGLTLVALGGLAFTAARWDVTRRGDRGSMSRQWLAEHRADEHGG